MHRMMASNTDQIRMAYNGHLTHGHFLPAVYVIEVTNKCNLLCKMCPSRLIQNDIRGEMSLELFGRIVEEVGDVAEHVMLYFMGEPLTRRDLSELLSKARREIRGKISLSTNGMLLNDDAARVLVDSGIDLVICCIDHIVREKYADIRRGGNLDIVENNTVNLLEKINSKHSAMTVVVKALDFGFSDDEREVFKKKWEEKGGIPIIGWVDTWAGQFPELIGVGSTPQPNCGAKRCHCADLWFKMVVNWRGTVVQCCHNYDYSFPIGHLGEDILVKDLWQNPVAVSLRQMHVDGMWAQNRLCASCSEWACISELEAYTKLDRRDLFLVF